MPRRSNGGELLLDSVWIVRVLAVEFSSEMISPPSGRCECGKQFFCFPHLQRPCEIPLGSDSLGCAFRLSATTKPRASRGARLRYYISSLNPDAKRFNTAIREHWGIENKLHGWYRLGAAASASRIPCRLQRMRSCNRNVATWVPQYGERTVGCAH